MVSRADSDRGAAPVLAARDVTKEYRNGDAVYRALQGVTLEVRAGRFVSIMGPSGSGKSTFLHLLGGLDVATSGTIELEGRSLSDMDDRERTLLRRDRIGVVFQFFNLVPVLSVEENIALPAVVARRRPDSYRARLDQLVELTGLGEHRQKLPSHLSGGQQQRVAVARALFSEPAILLADEPTGNLDSATGEEVLSLLGDARRELAQTVVMVTHSAEAAASGDEVVLLRDGLVAGHLDLPAGGEERAGSILAWLQSGGVDALPATVAADRAARPRATRRNRRPAAGAE